jgi:hypothetical protein
VITSQSSTYIGADSKRAIDNNTDGNFASGSCTHSNAETNPWWKADMGREMYIENVKTFNRVDCCSERLANYNVLIGNNVDITKNTPCPGGPFTGA